MNLGDWVPIPTPYDVLKFLVMLTGTLTVCNYLALLAWRAALRDTNVQKRIRIVQKLGIREPRQYMFVGFLHPNSYVY